MQPCKNAPAILVADHRDKKSAYHKLHAALLSEPSMDVVWKRLASKISTRKDWRWLMRAIERACTLANRKPRSTRKDENEYFDDIAKKAEELAELIGPKPGSPIYPRQRGELDSLIYCFFPDDVMAANGYEEWSANADQHSAMAGCWPSITEVLNVLGRTARHRALEAKTEDRIVGRVREDLAMAVFVRHIHGYLCQNCTWTPRDGIYSIITSLANAAIQAKAIHRGKQETLSRTVVQKLIQRPNKAP